MKKFTALFMAAVLVLPSGSSLVFGATDDRIFTDPVKNTYMGRGVAAELISNLNFSDVGSDNWAQESIIKGGTLNMVKGYGGDRFGPSSYVTNEEALAFVVRMMGLEAESLEAAAALNSGLNSGSGLTANWSIGYLYTAASRGIITAQEYNELTTLNSQYIQGNELVSSAPATRERVAQWIAMGLNAIEPGSLDLSGEKLSLFTFNDFESISVEYASAVDAIASKGIMKGDTNSNFNPKAGLTRAEMAQVLSNMSEIYYRLNNIDKKTGTVGGYRDAQEQSTATASGWRNYYIRTSAGDMDVIQYQVSQDYMSTSGTADVVVYKNGRAMSLSALDEGDQIEYLVDSETMEALYVKVTNPGLTKRSIEGTLYTVDTTAGTITIQDAAHKSYVYHMMDGVYGEGAIQEDGSVLDNYMIIDQKKQNIKNLPIGSTLKLNLKNDLVETIDFIGKQSLVTETRGIVTENNTDFGYITFIDNNRNEVTKNYYADRIRVEKTTHYDLEDEIGYLDEIFPNFNYDPRDADIMDIEPGDIIFVRYEDDDPSVISSLSASTNYVSRVGKILEITYGAGLTRYLIEYDNKQTAWFDAANGIFISKAGVPIASTNVNVGDTVKLLVNQATITPGHVMESVKEMAIEGETSDIANVLKGQLAGIDPMQKKLMVQNVQTLEKSGWSGNEMLKSYPLTSNDIEYYYEGQRVSLDYIERYLKRAEGEVYIATENSASGERIKKVSFRLGRDQVLNADTVISADGAGSFATASSNGNILTDSGTIVIKNGKLVTGNNISARDYTKISLNGGNTAAVVEITDTPDTSSIMIGRGRILSVNNGQSFKVQSMSALTGTEWVYTPVEREFTIDNNTLFLNENGYVDPNTFLGYSENSVVDKVYNIIYDGGRATHVIDAPYPNNAVRGTIVSITGDVAQINNAQYYESTTGKWMSVSRTNPMLTINVPVNCIVAKGNKAGYASSLSVGDNLMVLTNQIPTTITGGTAITGYIIMVQN